jgi:hypothetical protein
MNCLKGMIVIDTFEQIFKDFEEYKGQMIDMGERDSNIEHMFTRMSTLVKKERNSLDFLLKEFNTTINECETYRQAYMDARQVAAFLKSCVLSGESMGEKHVWVNDFFTATRKGIDAPRTNTVTKVLAAAKNPWEFSHDELAKFMRDYEEASEKHGYYESIVAALRLLFLSRTEALDKALIQALAGGGDA